MINIKNYGFLERLWLTFWSILNILWLLSYGRVDSYFEFAALNALALIILILWPIYSHRFKPFTLDISRIVFSFLSSWLAYERIAKFIAAYRSDVAYEPTMIAIDKFLIGGNPSEWFQAIHSPFLSEYFQSVYWFYFPQVLLVGLMLLALGKRRIFLQYLITLNLALMFTVIFYFIIPLRSPFYIADLGLFTDLIHFDQPLQGLWFFDGLRAGLLESTSMRHDCFPSGHTMHSLIAMFFAWKATRTFAIFETIIALSIVTSTLYLRYHYAIDLIAGAASAIMWYYIGAKLIKYALSIEPTEILESLKK